MNNDDMEKLAGWVFGILALYIGVALLGLAIGLTYNALQLFGWI
jgi:hypothetical protein